MKIKKFIKEIFKTKVRIIVSTVFLVVAIFLLSCLITYNHTSKADTTVLNKLLVEASDMVTAKLNLTNMTKYEDTGIKILNRSDFIMVYDATVWAGMDVKDIKVTSNDIKKVIYVVIPKATVLNAKVDPTSIKYFDEKFALFNVNSKEDANNAVALAEESLKEEAKKTGILELADKQSATLIEGLLSKAIPEGYSLEITVVK